MATSLLTGIIALFHCGAVVRGEVSDRQWRDIIGVLKTRTGELDLEYLRKWAADLHVGDLLERALKESS